MFKAEIKADVLKELKKMDKRTSAYLFDWINHNLVNVKNPRAIGKALKGETIYNTFLNLYNFM